MTNKFLLMVILSAIISNNFLQAQNFGSSSYFSIHHAVGGSMLESFSANNPAAIIENKDDFLLLKSKPSRFGLSEISPFLLTGSWQLDSNRTTGLNLSGISWDLYSDFSAEFRFANRIGSKLTIGASIEYSMLSVKNYGNESLGIVNLGALLNLSEDLKAGFLLRNMLGNHTESASQTVYQQVVSGLSYQLREDLIIDADISVIINSISSFSLGIKYLPLDFIAIRCAYKTNPNLIEISVMSEIVEKSFIIIGFEFHELFGFSPEIAVKYAF